MSYVDETALELANLALKEAAAAGDDRIVDEIGEMLSSASHILAEAYLSAVRVRRAEIRARKILAERAAARTGRD